MYKLLAFYEQKPKLNISLQPCRIKDACGTLCATRFFFTLEGLCRSLGVDLRFAELANIREEKPRNTYQPGLGFELYAHANTGSLSVIVLYTQF